MSAQERILAAAADLLREEPLAHLTVAAVARGAGVSRQTVYTHFADADDIAASVFIAYAEEHFRPRRARARSLEGVFWGDVEAAREFFAADLHNIAAFMLGSERMRQYEVANWVPLLARFGVTGDLEEKARWLSYQQTWLVAYPGALGTDERRYIKQYVLRRIDQ